MKTFFILTLLGIGGLVYSALLIYYHKHIRKKKTNYRLYYMLIVALLIVLYTSTRVFFTYSLEVSNAWRIDVVFFLVAALGSNWASDLRGKFLANSE